MDTISGALATGGHIILSIMATCLIYGARGILLDCLRVYYTIQLLYCELLVPATELKKYCACFQW